MKRYNLKTFLSKETDGALIKWADAQQMTIEFEQYLDKMIFEAGNAVHVEKLSGNVVKENYWKGEEIAFLQIKHWLINYIQDN